MRTKLERLEPMPFRTQLQDVRQKDRRQKRIHSVNPFCFVVFRPQSLLDFLESRVMKRKSINHCAMWGWAHSLHKLILIYMHKNTLDGYPSSVFRFVYAAGGTWTRTGIHPLPPQDSASAIPPRPQNYLSLSNVCWNFNLKGLIFHDIFHIHSDSCSSCAF